MASVILYLSYTKLSPEHLPVIVPLPNGNATQVFIRSEYHPGTTLDAMDAAVLREGESLCNTHTLDPQNCETCNTVKCDDCNECHACIAKSSSAAASLMRLIEQSSGAPAGKKDMH